jgi:hypothetical protein
MMQWFRVDAVRNSVFVPGWKILVANIILVSVYVLLAPPQVSVLIAPPQKNPMIWYYTILATVAFAAYWVPLAVWGVVVAFYYVKGRTPSRAVLIYFWLAWGLVALIGVVLALGLRFHP